MLHKGWSSLSPFTLTFALIPESEETWAKYFVCWLFLYVVLFFSVSRCVNTTCNCLYLFSVLWVHRDFIVNRNFLFWNLKKTSLFMFKTKIKISRRGCTASKIARHVRPVISFKRKTATRKGSDRYLGAPPILKNNF